MKRILIFIFLFQILFSNAQNAGDVDLAFPVNTGFNFDNTVKCILPLPDGKILVGGFFGGANNSISCLLRLNSDGTKDSSFTFSSFSADGDIAFVNCLKLQIDGKIIVGGSFNRINGLTQKKLVRLNPNGTLDATFNIGSGFSDDNWQNTGNIEAISIQSDGKIIVGGKFTKYNNITENSLIRLNSDGTKDLTFNIGQGFYFASGGWSVSNISIVKSLAIQTDGKVLVGGLFSQFNGTSQNMLIRLNADGSKDTSFNIGNGFTGPPGSMVNKVSLQPDGKIIVGGIWNSFNSTTSWGLIRLNSNGTKDLSFNSGGNGTQYVNDINLDNSGKIIVVGDFSSYNNTNIPYGMMRLNSNGILDTSLNLGSSFDNFTYCFSILNDGKILVGGDFTNFNGYKQNKLIRLNVNGLVDTSFYKMWNDGNFGNNSFINEVVLQSDGKIIAGGYFTKFNDLTQNGLIRLSSNGTKDESFNVGSGFQSFFANGVFSGTLYKVLLQVDGKILVCGQFTHYNGTFITNNQYNLIRLNANGILDNSFNFPTISKAELAIQNDGKILTINGNSIVRLNQNGVIDNTFNTNFNEPSKIFIQSDGKILVQYFNSGHKLTRLNSNGTLDSSFFIGTFSGSGINSITFLQNGKILVGGSFLWFNNLGVVPLIRLNTDGSLDSSFNASGIAPSGTWSVSSIVVQSDGKIIIGGSWMTGFQGWGGLKRLNPDGSVDSTYFGSIITIDIPEGDVSKVIQQSDGKILVVGDFDRYSYLQTYQSVSIIRLNGNYVNTTPAPTGQTNQSLCLGSTVESLNANGILIKWYSSAVGGTPLPQNLTLTNDTVYYASQTINGTESHERLAVTVNLIDLTVNLTTNSTCYGGTGIVNFYGTPNSIVSYSVDGGSIQTILLDSQGNATIQSPVLYAHSTYTLYDISLNIPPFCQKPITMSSTIIVNNIPIVFIYDSNSGTICSGNSTQIYLSSNLPGTSFDWVVLNSNVIGALNGSGTSIEQVLTLGNQLQGSVTYSITPIANGCYGTPQTITIFVTTSEPVEFSFGHDFCYGQNFTLPSLSDNGISGTWYPTSITENQAPGSYWYEFTPSNNYICIPNLGYQITIINIPQAPTANSTQSFNSGDTLANLSVTGTNLQWYSSSTGGTPLPLSTVLVNGATYYVSQTVNGCESSRVAITVTQNLSNEDFEISNINLFPNPTNGIFNIKSNGIIEKVDVYNLIGQKLFTQNISSNESIVNIEKYPIGHYLVKLYSDGKTKTFKIIKN